MQMTMAKETRDHKVLLKIRPRLLSGMKAVQCSVTWCRKRAERSFDSPASCQIGSATRVFVPVAKPPLFDGVASVICHTCLFVVDNFFLPCLLNEDKTIFLREHLASL